MNPSKVLSELYIPVVALTLFGVNTPSLRAAEQNERGHSAADWRCSDRTLRGLYAFRIEGVFVDAPAPLPLRGVALTDFDGSGKLRQVDHVVFNGTLPPLDWTPATGTYHINRDCTGEAEIIIPGSPFSPVTLRLVVSDGGNHIETVVSKPGYAVSSTATKVSPSK